MDPDLTPRGTPAGTLNKDKIKTETIYSKEFYTNTTSVSYLELRGNP
jgi:hypothetical protein